MLSENYAKAAVEVLDILDHTKTDDVEKISTKFISFLKENASTDYVSHLDHSKTLVEMNLGAETKGILGLIYKSYWADDSERKELDELQIKYELEKQEELKKMYNSNKIFEKSEEVNSEEKTSTESNESSVEMTEIKKSEGIFSNLINFIKNLFKKK